MRRDTLSGSKEGRTFSNAAPEAQEGSASNLAALPDTLQRRPHAEYRAPTQESSLPGLLPYACAKLGRFSLRSRHQRDPNLNLSTKQARPASAAQPPPLPNSHPKTSGGFASTDCDAHLRGIVELEGEGHTSCRPLVFVERHAAAVNERRHCFCVDL